MVDSAIPGGRFSRFQGETVGVEKETQGLDPGEGPCSAGGLVADETSIDLEVRIGDQTEMLVDLAVKVEDDAVSSDEPWVVACRSRCVTLWFVYKAGK